MSFKTSYCVNEAHWGSEQYTMGYYQDLFRMVGNATLHPRKNNAHEHIYVFRISALFFLRFITFFPLAFTRRVRRFAAEKQRDKGLR